MPLVAKDVEMPDPLIMRAKGSEMPLQYGMEMCQRCLRFSCGVDSGLWAVGA